MTASQLAAWDPLMEPTTPDLHWTTTNLAEALPGVVTPLSWSVWGTAMDLGTRKALYAVGAFTRADLLPRERGERFLRVFYGRVAGNMEFLSGAMDRMPGADSRAALVNAFGAAPEDMTYAPTKRRYPFVAARMPRSFARVARDVQAMAAEQDGWWRDSIVALPGLDRHGLETLMREADRRFHVAMEKQITAIFVTLMPLIEQTEKIVAAGGVGDLASLSASGGAESAVVGDMWKASRRQMTVEDVVRNHGFHGPFEGEASSVVWREDDTPLRRMIDQYAGLEDAEDPALHEAHRNPERLAITEQVIAAFPRWQQPGVRMTLSLARERIPLRGVGKRAFLQALDVMRATARCSAEVLADAGQLERPDDVFMLTATELGGFLPRDSRELAARRRERREEYLKLDIPSLFKGYPEPFPVDCAQPPEEAEDGVVRGLGVSPGVVEGRARIVTDPAFTEVEPGEVLVATTTDPSWCSIMFVSTALVVDIGATFSHAAVVARELDIPAVVNTGNGTKVLRNGDLLRVDGSAGTVEILERA